MLRKHDQRKIGREIELYIVNNDESFNNRLVNRGRQYNYTEAQGYHLMLILNSINNQPTTKMSPVVLDFVTTIDYLWFFYSMKSVDSIDALHITQWCIQSVSHIHSTLFTESDELTNFYGCFHFLQLILMKFFLDWLLVNEKK